MYHNITLHYTPYKRHSYKQIKNFAVILKLCNILSNASIKKPETANQKIHLLLNKGGEKSPMYTPWQNK